MICGSWLLVGCERGTPDVGPIFVDQAAASSLDFTYFNGSSGGFHMPEIMGAGTALFDYDNDGDLDLYLVQGRMADPELELDRALTPPELAMLPLGDRLYRNDLAVAADGSRRLAFTDVTEESGIAVDGYGMGVATGDVDNDGWIDLYVTHFGANRMLRNRGPGSDGRVTFEDVTAESGTGELRWSASAAFFDFDRDGRLDLYVTNYIDYDFQNHKVCQSLLGTPDYCRPSDYRSEPDRLFRNAGPRNAGPDLGTDGSVRFEDVSSSSGIDSVPFAGLGVVTGDFDGDGWIDVYVANDGEPNLLWVNRRDGTFEDRAMEAGAGLNREGLPEASMGVVAGDVDGDGDEDLLLTHLAIETNTFYRNEGSGNFQDLSRKSGLGDPSWEFTGFGTAWLDYDNDGWLDLLTVNGGVQMTPRLASLPDPRPLHMPDQFFRNRGNGRFEEISRWAGETFQLREVSRSLAVGDVDNDGDLDAVVCNNSGPVWLLINQLGQDRHWLGLRLIGGEGGRDMLGAWVGVLRPDTSSRWRRVRTDGGYLAANDPRLLIGLGESPAVAGVTVTWPDGREERFQVEADRYNTLRQGTGAGGTSDHEPGP